MYRSLSRLGDRKLLRDLAAAVARECISTAEVLLLIAEVDARRLYLSAAYPCMREYCVGELHLSVDAASKRIQVARAARQCPVLFEALVDGRLHLTGARLLAPHLTTENAVELISACTHKTKAQIETLIAERFPGTEVMQLVYEPATVRKAPDASETVDDPGHALGHVGTFGNQRAPPMKTGCPAKSSWTIPPRPSLTSRLFGVMTSAPGFVAEERGPTRGNGL